jgi:hypothetical protein
MINVQEISDSVLWRVIKEGHEVEWNFYALKVMIMRLRLKLKMSGHVETVKQECYTDMRGLFRKSGNIPSAKKDLQIIVERFMQS